MKKTMKLLSVLLLGFLFGVNTLNVNAASCAEGTVEHTNYYLFLNVNTVEAHQSKLDAATGGVFFYYTGAWKYNNIMARDVKTSGNVAITYEQETTSASASESWPVTEFWKKYYDTYIHKNSNSVWDEDERTSYFLHDKWYRYTSDQDIDGEEAGDSSSRTKLIEYIGNLGTSNLPTSDLIIEGTVFPDTNVYTNVNLGNVLDPIPFRTTRRYNSSVIEGKTGINIDGKMNLYSPAVYKVVFCEDEGEKELRYDQNYNGEKPENFPSTQTFEESCTTVSTKTPEREGYTFVGWGTSKTAKTPSFAEGDEYCGPSATLYAIWEEKSDSGNGTTEEPVGGPFTVSYDANKGTNAPASQTGNTSEKVCVTISDKDKMALTGNKFLGWSRKSDPTEADSKYAPGEEYCGEDGDITLYAVWSPSTGISTHIIAFGFVAIAATGAYIVARKKNLFKQI